MPHDSIDNQGAHKKSEASSSRKRKLNYQSSYGLQLSCIEAYDGTVIKICYQFRKLGNALTIKVFCFNNLLILFQNNNF